MPSKCRQTGVRAGSGTERKKTCNVGKVNFDLLCSSMKHFAEGTSRTGSTLVLHYHYISGFFFNSFQSKSAYYWWVNSLLFAQLKFNVFVLDGVLYIVFFVENQYN
jgi:hypothetical protein